MKNKLNDFLKNKIIFTMIFVKRQKLFQFNTIENTTKTTKTTKKFIFIDFRFSFFLFFFYNEN